MLVFADVTFKTEGQVAIIINSTTILNETSSQF